MIWNQTAYFLFMIFIIIRFGCILFLKCLSSRRKKRNFIYGFFKEELIDIPRPFSFVVLNHLIGCFFLLLIVISTCFV